MLHIGTQIYLIGFCEPIKGTQGAKINDLQKPCLPRFGTHLHKPYQYEKYYLRA